MELAARQEQETRRRMEQEQVIIQEREEVFSQEQERAFVLNDIRRRYLQSKEVGGVQILGGCGIQWM